MKLIDFRAEESPDVIYVNPDHVVEVTEYHHGTDAGRVSITLTSGAVVHVQEGILTVIARLAGGNGK